jgi:hypothetical protein
MSKKPNTIFVEQLVLVQDPILGSKYELQMVEVEAIDVVTELSETLTKELKKATKKATKKAAKNEQ